MMLLIIVSTTGIIGESCLVNLIYRPRRVSSPKKIRRVYILSRKWERKREREREKTFVGWKGESAKTLSSYVTGSYDGTTQLRGYIELGGVANAFALGYSSKFAYVNPNYVPGCLLDERDANFWMRNPLPFIMETWSI